jgi:hypothetical protein
MGKIFGYKQVEREDWYSIEAAYSDQEIEKVKDPEGGAVTTLPTAIPSPFARMDLVKTAFQNISRTPRSSAFLSTDCCSCSNAPICKFCFTCA